VYWSKSRKKWRASISANNKRKWLGTFVDEDDAARAYDAAVRKHYPGDDKPMQWRAYNLAGSEGSDDASDDGGDSSSSSSSEEEAAADRPPRQQRKTAQLNFPSAPGAAGHRTTKKRRRSRHRGVSWNKSRKKWETQIYVDGKKKYIGTFADEDDAARAYDDAARRGLRACACRDHEGIDEHSTREWRALCDASCARWYDVVDEWDVDDCASTGTWCDVDGTLERLVGHHRARLHVVQHAAQLMRMQ
jgi:hypothetical protein